MKDYKANVVKKSYKVLKRKGYECKRQKYKLEK